MKSEPVNIIKDDDKIGTYVLNRLAIDNLDLKDVMPDYEMHVFNNDDKRVGMISVSGDTIDIKNSLGELKTMRVSQSPPTSLITQAAHILIEYEGAPTKEVGEQFMAELQRIAAGTHRRGQQY